MNITFFLFITAMVTAFLISFTTTPLVRVLAYKLNALDVPKDDRRMHKDIVPRLGGLAIFFGFIVAASVFCKISNTLISLLLGGLIIVALGVFDDIKSLNFLIKFAVQIVAAFVPVLFGQTISFINFFGNYITLGVFEIPVTVLWIVGLTNAINLIDGLDGLSCGVSAICSFSLMLCSVILLDNVEITMLSGILMASCLGFLPFNSNPAKIFMGDTGALFLGYTLSVLSINGLFKTHAALSFLIPLSIFGLPLFDTCFAFIRRIFHGQSPFKADRGHIHHRLVDGGFNQKQTAYILYSVCGLLGISAVMFTSESFWKAGLVIICGITIFFLNYKCMKNPDTRIQTGIFANKDNNDNKENVEKDQE